MREPETTNNFLPYEKFQTYGPETMTDAELLAIILRTGTKDMSALELAETILQKSRNIRPGLLGLNDLSLKELKAIKGIGEVKAVKLKALFELAIRISSTSASANVEKFSNPREIAERFMEKLRHKKTETVICAYLDSKCQLIAEKTLSTGSVNMSLISPRDIFIEALKNDAVFLILVHNHPSGDPSPSRDDIKFTRIVHKYGTDIGIKLLDHIVIGDNKYFSFNAEKLM
ncbi:MAG: DNA repair protein RadC [Lachnospiraceae bacterium]|nr:DNA repair protein RadC [Lachnospiraceae bacterium]